MPPNTRSYLVRRLGQCDEAVRRAQAYLADIAKTFEPYYPEYRDALLAMIEMMDPMHDVFLDFHQTVFGGSTRFLVGPDYLLELLQNARTIKVLPYASQNRSPKEVEDEPVTD